MFFISGIVILTFVVLGIYWGVTIDSETLAEAAGNWRNGVGEYFGWLYVAAATFFLIFVLYLLFSRFGAIKLGPDDSKPEFGTMAWFSMLFTAGMGIGLVFFGAYEPTWYTRDDDPLVAEGATDAVVAEESMSQTLFHWGFHPWAIYIVLGLALGYFCFRKGLPLRPASAFYPLIGDRVYGWPGHTIDILAVFGTMFGLATSLGLGTQQIAAGLNDVFGIDNESNAVVLIIITLITLMALASVILGIDKGIRRLSVITMWLAVVLVVVVFLAGPKLYMINGMADWTGAYLQTLPEKSLAVASAADGDGMAGWQQGWTFFYWGWWISWAPFVGMFIARISYGRTIRQFIAGVLFAPFGATVVWFGIFGGSGIFYELRGAGISDDSSDVSMFRLLEQLPLADIIVTLLSVLTILIVAMFFVTSSDSGSLVIDILTNGGDPNPNRIQRAFWALLEGLVAAVLIVVGGAGALAALQAASLTTGVPFAIVLIFVVFGLLKALKQENTTALQARAGAGSAAPVSSGSESAEVGSGGDKAAMGPPGG